MVCSLCMGLGQGDGKRWVFVLRYVLYTLHRGREQLFSIVPIPVPVPVPVPFLVPCSVYEPLLEPTPVSTNGTHLLQLVMGN